MSGANYDSSVVLLSLSKVLMHHCIDFLPLDLLYGAAVFVVQDRGLITKRVLHKVGESRSRTGDLFVLMPRNINGGESMEGTIEDD